MSRTTELEVIPPTIDTRITTEDVHSRRLQSFADFALNEKLQLGIYERGYERPSPIQEVAIPQILARNNVIGRAKNGTGKTASYVIPAIELIDHSLSHIQVLILVPARELTLQVSQEVKQLGRHCGTRSLAVYGGQSIEQDLRNLSGTSPHVLVATPARALDLVRSRAISLSHVRLICLDEADKLVSQEDFLNPVTSLIVSCPESRRIAIFSATFPRNVKDFAERYMPGYKSVNTMQELTLRGITQYMLLITEATKLKCLKALLRTLRINQAIFFCNSITRVELLAKRIFNYGYPCYYVHSQMDQHDRNRVYDLFRRGEARYLVASDVFGRGIDVPAINVVFNFDFPQTAETYLHRIGRGGRFGHYSLAINFITKEDEEAHARIEQELGVHMQQLPEDEIPADLYCS